MAPEEKSEAEKAARDSIRAMRRSYGEVGLVNVDSDPIVQFQNWLSEAANNSMVVEANAMVLSTSTSENISSRTVLLKDVTPAGFTFFTNYLSHKASEIAANPLVALLFPWYAMERQVMIQGIASKVSAVESDDYFATRPWGSQIGAWASAQSRVLNDRADLEARQAEFAAKYPEGSPVPRPGHWGGYIVAPTTIELWQGRYSRLHDRVRYIKTDSSTNGGWDIQRFYP
jgi:pyridoxamine 5'-phosphate oxidase